MKIAGDYRFEGPQELVWDTLMDPDVLASVLPGCEKLEQTGDNEYQGALEIKIGPVQGKFMGKVQLEDIHKPDSYTMKVNGQGASGFVNATGHLALAPEDGETRVTYEGDANVGGRLAAVGQRLVESSAKAIIKQSLDGLNEAVKARASAGGGGPGGGAAEDGGGASDSGASGGSGGGSPPPAPKKPSQAQFATNVAKEVVADLIPAPVRYGIAVVVIAGLLYLLYTLFLG
jgi:carbon monoxide dehydrogenase subunit G